jgi:hypothetical protein
VYRNYLPDVDILTDKVEYSQIEDLNLRNGLPSNAQEVRNGVSFERWFSTAKYSFEFRNISFPNFGINDVVTSVDLFNLNESNNKMGFNNSGYKPTAGNGIFLDDPIITATTTTSWGGYTSVDYENLESESDVYNSSSKGQSVEFQSYSYDVAILDENTKYAISLLNRVRTNYDYLSSDYLPHPCQEKCKEEDPLTQWDVQPSLAFNPYEYRVVTNGVLFTPRNYYKFEFVDQKLDISNNCSGCSQRVTAYGGSSQLDQLYPDFTEQLIPFVVIDSGSLTNPISPVVPWTQGYPYGLTGNTFGIYG